MEGPWSTRAQLTWGVSSRKPQCVLASIPRPYKSLWPRQAGGLWAVRPVHSCNTGHSGGKCVKLVQMPTDLLHLDDAELSAVDVAPGLLEAFRLYLPRALDDRRGAAMLAPPSARTRELLMVLARRVGATLRDENIRLRERGGDLRSARKKLCYLPGRAMPKALRDPVARRALAHEAACFIQDLDTAWPEDQIGRAPLAPTAVL